MPRWRVDGKGRAQRGAQDIESVLAQLRFIGQARDPDDPRYNELRARAVRAFTERTRGTKRNEQQALDMFEALRKRPELLPGEAPHATPLPKRTPGKRR